MVFIRRGSLYHWREYSFEDGSSKDKYWLALNCTVNNAPFYAVLPTSQYNKHYHDNLINLLDTVIIEEDESNYFSKKTVIDLKKIRQEDSKVIDRAIEHGRLTYIGQLEPEILAKIKDTVENAYTLSQQIIDDLNCD